MKASPKKRPSFEPESTFRLTEPPNTNWRYGDSYMGSLGAEDWAKDEEQGWKTFDTSQMTPREIYPLMISGIIPRPIAFVSSLSPAGVPNLAPFSYFSMVSHHPPLVSISFLHPRHKEKDTSENIRATKAFTVNIISEPFVANANFTSIDAPADVDEWIGSGLTKEPSTIVKSPRVKESAFSMECELYHLHDLCPPGSSEVTGTLILGHIRMLHVRKAVLSEKGIVKANNLRPVSRLGGKMYGRLGDAFELPRLSWEKEKDVVNELQKKP
ncbi:hypothetical protein M422DRAFT_175244 [Sphaerobolus stellatus SS14]|uniref:Unplaced genomic scaffold SPHSTscaffold_77, whole genome shotgun sequence n=1 Tax=Sphaerobolus stellatus (strain SS14) TaxID=990650 RepID=A0A0C9VNY3_SPHS4|nr:hypothetical protein M422DRAFT_175244 [Sphaerobolus stellatus SS14]